MINPGSGEAVYRQVARLLEERIDREAEPGYLLPPAEQLAREFGLGTDTIRDAINLLVHMGRVSLRRGYGPVVRTPRKREVIKVSPGTVVSARMPTFDEIDEWQMEPGFPMIIVDGRAYPADRYEARADDEIGT